MKKLLGKGKQVAYFAAATFVGAIAFGAYKVYKTMKELDEKLDLNIHSDYDGD